MATSPKTRGRKSTNKNGKEPVENVPEEEPASEQEEGDEDGYEVEAILDAKWAYNKRGKWSYFVHWKGYESNEDMWIDEDDAGGAEELINDWHEKHELPRDGKGKKKSAAKRGRASAGAATKDKKRKASSTDGMDVDTSDANEPPTKKSTKSSKKAASPEVQETDGADGEVVDEVEFASLDEYMTKTRWDNVVKHIETVEDQHGTLIVLFTREDGLKSKCATSILAERCPQLLIAFYETHLKWRPSEED